MFENEGFEAAWKASPAEALAKNGLTLSDEDIAYIAARMGVGHLSFSDQTTKARGWN